MSGLIDRLKNNNGFSILQAMMIAAILGTMAFMNMTIMNHQQNANKKTDDIARANLLTKQIRELLLNPGRCQHFLGSFSPAAIGSGHTIDPDDNGTVVAGEETLLDNRRVITSDIVNAVANYTAANVLFKPNGTAQAGGEIIHNGLKIIAFQTGPQATPAPGRASVVVHYFPERTSVTTDTDKNISGEIPIVFTTTAGGIVDTCWAE